MEKWQKGPGKWSSLRAMHTLVISTSMDDTRFLDTLSQHRVRAIPLIGPAILFLLFLLKDACG